MKTRGDPTVKLQKSGCLEKSCWRFVSKTGVIYILDRLLMMFPETAFRNLSSAATWYGFAMGWELKWLGSMGARVKLMPGAALGLLALGEGFLGDGALGEGPLGDGPLS